MHRIILMDHGNRLLVVAVKRNRLDQSFIEKTDQVTGEKNTRLCREAFELAGELTRSWINHIDAMPEEKPPGWAHRKYWQALNREAGINDRRAV